MKFMLLPITSKCPGGSAPSAFGTRNWRRASATCARRRTRPGLHAQQLELRKLGRTRCQHDEATILTRLRRSHKPHTAQRRCAVRCR